MMLMYIDSDDSENYDDCATAGIAVSCNERLLLEAPSSNEERY